MVEKSRLESPASEGVGFDLNRALASVVAVRSVIAADAFTATILGTERVGSGVVIGESGLVLTIGYLITEAESIWLTDAEGRVTPAHALAYDQETGFGLLQALDKLDLPAMEFAQLNEAKLGDPVIVAGGGRKQSLRARIIAREEFAGYWEYLLDHAIFTAPAHPFWGGAGLIDRTGKLLGIGSLHIQQVTEQEQRQDVNMIVPIDLLPPILNDLLTYGRINKPPRPWLGIFSAENDGKIVVANLAERGPAAAAGLRQGDIICAVRDSSVTNLSEFYRKVWNCGPAGAEIPVEIERDHRRLRLQIKSADRNSYLKKPRLH
jgi:S1-C subfamily serine protease